MGFITSNERYYRHELDALEQTAVSPGSVLHARRLLKVLDDLADEGYVTLNEHMETDFSCLTRLRSYLARAGARPFEVGHPSLPRARYGIHGEEVTAVAGRLLADAREVDAVAGNAFLGELLGFCRWVGYEEGTAYVFLLRDALLPYLYYRSRGRQRLHPWLVSRRFMDDLAGVGDVDDEIRLPIYDALEQGHTDFEPFDEYCGERIRRVLDRHAPLRDALTGLLSGIGEERIVVVESGYCGTVPMMLGALDARVEMRMFTTAPFLVATYGPRVYTDRYEDLRHFETLRSQDTYLRYAAFRDGRFLVRQADDATVRRQALAEIRAFMP